MNIKNFVPRLRWMVEVLHQFEECEALQPVPRLASTQDFTIQGPRIVNQPPP